MLEILFSSQGRINRAKFWVLYLAAGFGLSVVVAIALIVETELAAIAPSASFFDGARLQWPRDVAGQSFAVLLAAVLALFSYCAVVVVIKRLHDRNKSAWWLGLFFGIPLAGFAGMAALGLKPAYLAADFAILLIMSVFIGWYLIEVLFLPGTAGANRFGAEPEKRDRSRLFRFFPG